VKILTWWRNVSFVRKTWLRRVTWQNIWECFLLHSSSFRVLLFTFSVRKIPLYALCSSKEILESFRLWQQAHIRTRPGDGLFWDKSWCCGSQESTVFKPVRPVQPPAVWLPGPLYKGIRSPKHETDNTPPPNTKIKNTWSRSFTPPYVPVTWFLI
jgi:hypothetical protein